MKSPGATKPDSPPSARTTSALQESTSRHTLGHRRERFDIQATPAQAAFLNSPPAGIPLADLQAYAFMAGASSGIALNGSYPSSFAFLPPSLVPAGLQQFPSSCNPAFASVAGFNPYCTGLPASFQTLVSQEGNFPVFEGTSLYAFRIDHNVSNNNRLTLRVNASPSTVTGIEGSGQDQPFGQNAYSRTSQQSYRDVAGVAQDTWTLGTSKVNEFRFQYARRGLNYYYNTKIPAGSDPAVNIPGYGYFGREPYSYIARVETRYQFTDNFSWSIGRHNTKFGADFNYLPLTATFTVNYGGVYDFGSQSLFPTGFPSFSPVQAYGLGMPGDFIQGLGSPSDSFSNKPLGMFWQDSWRVNHNLTLNYGVRYDIEFPPTFPPPTGLADTAQTGYNFLGLQKGIQTGTKHFQPRIGVAWDPKGDGKTVVRASFGIFYDHPLLGLYFLGQASDGSASGQLAFAGTGFCSSAGSAGNLNAIPIFQGNLINSASPQCAPSSFPQANANLFYEPNQQQFQSLNTPNSVFLNQNYLNLAQGTFLPLGFQPFGYPQAKNFVYAYSQQANLTIERDLGGGYALSLAYNFNGGRHLNRPINAKAVRGDLMTANFFAASAALPASQAPDSPFTVGTGSVPCGTGPLGPWVSAPLMNFFRRGGLNPAIAAGLQLAGAPAWRRRRLFLLPCRGSTRPAIPPRRTASPTPAASPSATWTPTTPTAVRSITDSAPISASASPITTNFWPPTPGRTPSTIPPICNPLLPRRTAIYPGLDRSSSLFDQRHRFVFSGVYQSGKLSGSGFASKFFSNWTFAPSIEFSSGRPFNIITGNGDNLQLSSLTGRPNTFVNPACTAIGYAPVLSKFSPTGVFQEPCILDWNGQIGPAGLESLDGNLGRNAGITPWTVFNDVRFAKRIYFGERFNMDFITDMFNIANRYNVAAVSPLFTNAGQATAAYDPRQFQFALKLNW